MQSSHFYKLDVKLCIAAINPFTPKGSPLTSKIVWCRQGKVYKAILGHEMVKGDSFLTLSLPSGLPLMSKIIWHL